MKHEVPRKVNYFMIVDKSVTALVAGKSVVARQRKIIVLDLVSLPVNCNLTALYETKNSDCACYLP